jgi:hypothetical protein
MARRRRRSSLASTGSIVVEYCEGLPCTRLITGLASGSIVRLAGSRQKSQLTATRRRNGSRPSPVSGLWHLARLASALAVG